MRELASIGGAGQLLFDIGITGDFVGNLTQKNVEKANAGTFSGRENRFFPREVELSFFGQIDPYARADVRIEAGEEKAGSETDVSLAEATITLLSLPYGTQAKLEYLPARHTDFIFAVLGEEWGFIGVVIALGLYLFLVVQALTFAKHARDRGGTFLVICLISFVIFHVLINVSMQIGILPTTGIPLPLISYGGSSTDGGM